MADRDLDTRQCRGPCHCSWGVLVSRGTELYVQEDKVPRGGTTESIKAPKMELEAGAAGPRMT
jgi:hypothetical protein